MVKKKSKLRDKESSGSKKAKPMIREPKEVFEVRKKIRKKNTEALITFGVALLIVFLWLLSIWVESVIGNILGVIVLALSIIFMSYGYYRRTVVEKMKPISVYEHGLKMPQIDGTVEYFPFTDFSKYPRESAEGYETIILKKGQTEFTLVPWPELLRYIEKRSMGAKASKSKKKAKKESI